MGGGTGRFPGRDVKQDFAKHGLISYLFHSVYMEKPFAGTIFVPSWRNGIPVRSTRIPAKAGQFLSYKQSVPLSWDDIMLTLQIVSGEIGKCRHILM